LQRGSSQHSFGIHVARMAGIPQAVIDRANEILEQLEQKTISKGLNKAASKIPKQEMQLNIFNAESPELKRIKEELENININTLTPVEALLRLQELKRMIEK